MAVSNLKIDCETVHSKVHQRVTYFVRAGRTVTTLREQHWETDTHRADTKTEHIKRYILVQKL